MIKLFRTTSYLWKPRDCGQFLTASVRKRLGEAVANPLCQRLSSTTVRTALFVPPRAAEHLQNTSFVVDRRYSMETGPVYLKIKQKLEGEFKPTVLQVVNESYKHAVPRGSETHFKVVIVSDSFQGLTPIKRHRRVNSVLSEELSSVVHALSIQAKTPEQWEQSGKTVSETPPCLGGSKADRH